MCDCDRIGCGFVAIHRYSDTLSGLSLALDRKLIHNALTLGFATVPMILLRRSTLLWPWYRYQLRRLEPGRPFEGDTRNFSPLSTIYFRL